MIGSAEHVLAAAPVPKPEAPPKRQGDVSIDAGVVHAADASSAFLEILIAQSGKHRHFMRPGMEQVPV